MNEERLTKMLKEIEDISARKEVSQIYRKVIANLSKYQEEQLQRIQDQVQKTLSEKSPDYAVDMLLCDRAEANRWQEEMEPLLTTGMLAAQWGSGAIERIYIRAARWVIERELAKEKAYNAVIETNYETYPITVRLQAVEEGMRQVEHINKLLFLNRVDLPKVNDVYVRKFYDICFGEVKDRIRPDEVIERVEVEWEELAPYIQKDVTLLWNLRRVEVKESGFPKAMPMKDRVRYKHEIPLPRKQRAYLLGGQAVDRFTISGQEESITVMTDTNHYQNWELYEILPRGKTGKGKAPTDILTNAVKSSVFAEILSARFLYTSSELYRKLMSYEISCFFEKIELREREEILFYPANKEDYRNADVMQFILEDMSCLYGDLFTGRLVNDEQ